MSSSERPCPVCGSVDYTLFTQERIDETRINAFTYASRKQPEFMCLRLVVCVQCDLIYAPTPPAESYLGTAYAQADFDSQVEAHCAALSYMRALKPLLARQVKLGAAIDVGAGSGPLLPMLRAAGFESVVGIEPSHAAIEAAEPAARAMLRKGLFTPQLVSDLRPAFIGSFMTLEHIREPGEFVRLAHGLLVPQGMFALVVHDRSAWLNRLLGFRSPIIDVEHLQLFNPRSVRELLERAGYTHVQITRLQNAYPLRYWLRLSPLPTGLKAALTALLRWCRLDGMIVPLNVGNILAVGYRPAQE